MTTRPRCSACYRPLGPGVHVCPPDRVQPAPRAAERKPAPTVNRRRNPLSRQEYLDSVRTTPEHQRERARLRQQAYRARRRQAGSCETG